MNITVVPWLSQGRSFDLQWSPDGSQILFDIGSKIYAVDAEAWASPPRTVVDAAWEVVINGEVRVREETYTSFDVSTDGKIAFSRCADRRKDGYGQHVLGLDIEAAGRHQFEIAVSNIDGSDVKKLIQRPEPPRVWNGYTDGYKDGYNWPAWSPDGSRVAYLGDWVSHKGRTTLYSVAADGTDERPLIDRRYFGEDKSLSNFPPAWSPDGRHLAVLGAGLAEVYTVRSDGSDLTTIATAALSAPSWSPNGQRIAVAVADGEGGAVLRTFAPDGSDPVTLASIIGADDDLEYPFSIWEPRSFLVRNLSWSPDESKIMYTCGTEICAVGAADGSVGWETALELNAGAVAAWSPDGSKIAVVDWEDNRLSLYTITSDGTNVQTIIGNWCVPETSCDWGN